MADPLDSIVVWKKILWSKLPTLCNQSLKMLRCSVFVWEPSIAKVLSEFVNSKHGKNSSSLCDTTLSFGRFRSNQYQNRARFYTRAICSFVYNNKMFRGVKFKRRRTTCRDEHRGGRPNEVTTPEMEKKIHKMVLDDCRLKVCNMADTLDISKSAVLIENLKMEKLCARWVPRLLTTEQKQCYEECLTTFRLNKAEFLRRFITVDETWVHHFTPGTKQHSKQWSERGESIPKKAQTAPSDDKTIVSVLSYVREIIFTDYLQREKTINCGLIAVFNWWNQEKAVAFG